MLIMVEPYKCKPCIAVIAFLVVVAFIPHAVLIYLETVGGKEHWKFSKVADQVG